MVAKVISRSYMHLSSHDNAASYNSIAVTFITVYVCVCVCVCVML